MLIRNKLFLYIILYTYLSCKVRPCFLRIARWKVELKWNVISKNHPSLSFSCRVISFHRTLLSCVLLQVGWTKLFCSISLDLPWKDQGKCLARSELLWRQRSNVIRTGTLSVNGGATSNSTWVKKWQILPSFIR